LSARAIRNHLRLMRPADIPAILELEAAAFPSIPNDRYWKPAMLEAHIAQFPEGQWVIEADGNIVASATALRLPLIDAVAQHTWKSITGNGYLTTHDPYGDALYGTEVMVHPNQRRNGLGKRLYRRRQLYIHEHGLRAFVAGGRIPGYHRHADHLSAPAYVRAVLAEELSDRTLTAQVRSGMSVAGLLPNYMHDPKSLDWASLLVWWNLDHGI